MAISTEERPLYPKQLAERCGNVVKEATWRAWQCRARNPMPYVRQGDSGRPHRATYPSVADAMLLFEMGVAPYAEVEQAARRVSVGALQ